VIEFRAYKYLLRRGVDFGLLLVASVMLILALVNPQARLRHDIFDYLVVVDITQSMNTLDYHKGNKPVSRLSFVKQALHQALLKLPCGSKIGLGIFSADRSYVLFEPVEICANYQAITTTLANIDNRMAWVDRSEIAKGLYSGLGTVASLPGHPALVFITDGQESPPINPRIRPVFNGKPGEAKGVIIGAGGLIPMPIPKFDHDGRPLGYWRADEVLQAYNVERPGSIKGEEMLEPTGPVIDLGATPGSEQLSELREPYLKLLAEETSLHYRRLKDFADMTAALENHDLAQQTDTRVSIAWIPALLAFICLLGIYAFPIRYGNRTNNSRSVPG